MFRRILLALESGEPGAVAVSFTVALAKRSGAHVDVVHVHERVLGARLAGGGPDDAAQVVADALCELQAAGVKASGMLYCTSRFDVADAVCDVAHECRSEAIVVGSRRRRRVRPGATRERIVRLSPLPVVTAPSPLRVPRRERRLVGASAASDLPVLS